MKICLTQLESVPGDVAHNMAKHQQWVARATAVAADLIIFPELSLTAYEPTLAHALATDQSDARLNKFQTTSDRHGISIGVGMPIRSAEGILLSMVVFQPHQPRTVYAKQHLHADELPFFIPGHHPTVLTIAGRRIALAICYESLLNAHAATAHQLGADLYVASVAKSASGMEKAYAHYPKIAAQYAMPVLMANCTGVCDNFRAAGQTSAWDERGRLVGQLSDDREAMLLYNTDSATTQQWAAN